MRRATPALLIQVVALTGAVAQQDGSVLQMVPWLTADAAAFREVRAEMLTAATVLKTAEAQPKYTWANIRGYQCRHCILKLNLESGFHPLESD